MHNTYKIYGLRRNWTEINPNYYEVPYTKYRNGVIVDTGTEDFSSERIRSITQVAYDAKEATGRINKGGGVMREVCGGINGYVNKNDEKTARAGMIKSLKEKYSGKDIRIIKIL